jgi:polyisoprenoid-binding protein YceI
MKMFSLILLTLLVQTYGTKVSSPQAEIKFSIVNAGFDVDGTIAIMNVEMKFDSENLSASFIHAAADPSSIDTGIDIRDKHLKRSDYFHVTKYPEISIRSRSFKKTGRYKFTGQFDLTIKGITKTVAIPFIMKKENDKMKYEAIFEINRLEYGIGEPSITVDETVRVYVTVREP